MPLFNLIRATPLRVQTGSGRRCRADQVGDNSDSKALVRRARRRRALGSRLMSGVADTVCSSKEMELT